MKKPASKSKKTSSAGVRSFTPAAKGKTKSPFGKTQKRKTQKLKG